MEQGPILELKPIGVIHSPYKSIEEAPFQGYMSEEISEIELLPQFQDGLKDIEGFSHLVVIYWFHKAEGYHLLVRTPWDERLHGVFATRSSHRPCPLGLTVVELVARQNNVLRVKGLDAIDGTPVLDIKPYLPVIDGKADFKAGWLEGKLGTERI